MGKGKKSRRKRQSRGHNGILDFALLKALINAQAPNSQKQPTNYHDLKTNPEIVPPEPTDGWVNFAIIKKSAMDYKSPANTIHNYLNKLHKKGLIDKERRSYKDDHGRVCHKNLYRLKNDEATFKELFKLFFEKNLIYDFLNSNYYRNCSVAEPIINQFWVDLHKAIPQFGVYGKLSEFNARRIIGSMPFLFYTYLTQKTQLLDRLEFVMQVIKERFMAEGSHEGSQAGSHLLFSSLLVYSLIMDAGNKYAMLELQHQLGELYYSISSYEEIKNIYVDKKGKNKPKTEDSTGSKGRKNIVIN